VQLAPNPWCQQSYREALYQENLYLERRKAGIMMMPAINYPS